MKKVIAVLAVLAIVAGFAFAGDPQTESHKIQLQTVIEGTPPAFQLKYSDEIKTNTTPSTFADNGTPYGASSAVSVGDLSTTPVTVTFDAMVANPAKQVKIYYLTFEAGAFTVRRNGSEESLAAKTGAEDTYVTANAALKDGNGVTVKTIENKYELKASFNGTTCGDTTKLGTFTVTYPQDSRLDPGTYTAYITMTVKTS